MSAVPWQSRECADTVTVCGEYETPDGATYRVRESKTPGRFFAERWTEFGTWKYEPGAIYLLHPSMLIEAPQLQ